MLMFLIGTGNERRERDPNRLTPEGHRIRSLDGSSRRIDDPLVIKMKIANSCVKRILVDSCSSANIITLDCLRKLKYTEKDVTPTSQPLIGFGGGSVYPRICEIGSEARGKRER